MGQWCATKLFVSEHEGDTRSFFSSLPLKLQAELETHCLQDGQFSQEGASRPLGLRELVWVFFCFRKKVLGSYFQDPSLYL